MYHQSCHLAKIGWWAYVFSCRSVWQSTVGCLLDFYLYVTFVCRCVKHAWTWIERCFTTLLAWRFMNTACSLTRSLPSMSQFVKSVTMNMINRSYTAFWKFSACCFPWASDYKQNVSADTDRIQQSRNIDSPNVLFTCMVQLGIISASLILYFLFCNMITFLQARFSQHFMIKFIASIERITDLLSEN